MQEDIATIKQVLLDWMQQQQTQIITTSDVARLIGCTKKKAHTICFSLNVRKWLTTIVDNYYLLAEPEKYHIPQAHPLIIARYITKPYYISFHTALSYHGFTSSQDSPIYIATINNRNHVETKDNTYRIVFLTSRKFFGSTSVNINDQEIQMADREKTLVDSLERPWYAGGIINVIEILSHTIDSLDITRLVDYAVQMQSSVLIQRLGYLLDQLDVSFNDEFMLSYARRSLYYLDPIYSCDMKPERNEKWNLMVNIPPSLYSR